MEDIYKDLLKVIDDKERILLNEPMDKHTTFKIGGIADIFIKVKKEEELKGILNISNSKSIPITVIGNGSNVLVKDRRNKRNNFKDMF